TPPRRRRRAARSGTPDVSAPTSLTRWQALPQRFYCRQAWHPTCQRPGSVSRRGTYDDGSFQSDGVAPAALADRPRFGGRNQPLCRFRAAARGRAVVFRTPRGLGCVVRSAFLRDATADPVLLDPVPVLVRAGHN